MTVPHPSRIRSALAVSGRPSDLDSSLPAFVILAGLAPVTWLVSSTVGYLASALFVCALLAYGLSRGHLVSVSTPLVLLFAVYWLLLLAQLAVTGATGFLPYVLLTPLVVASLIVVAPRLVLEDRLRYATTLAVLVLALTGIGFVLLGVHLTTGAAFPWTGRRVLGLYPWRIASVYGNSNHYGFVAAIGTLTSLYVALRTRNPRWLLVAVVLLVGVVLSNARIALLGVVCGGVVLCLRYRLLVGVGTAVAVAVGAALALQSPVFETYLEFAAASLARRIVAWSLVVEAIAADPLIGAGFRTDLLIHNAYLAILLNTGVLAGGVYLLILLLSFGTALVRAVRGGLWEAYVFSVLLVLYVQFTVETATIGGLSTESLLLSLYIGLVFHGASDRSRARRTVAGNRIRGTLGGLTDPR